MTTMNISVPEEMRAFVESQMTQGGYASASEYLRALIRDAQETPGKARARSQAARGTARPIGQDDPQGVGFYRARSTWRADRKDNPAMSRNVHLRRKARQDVMEIFRYYAGEAGLRIARRFLSQLRATSTRLAGMPGIGNQFEHEHPALDRLRVVPVSRFPKYLVFYRPVADGIEIVRVLYGAHDIAAILAEEFAVEDQPSDDPDTDDPAA